VTALDAVLDRLPGVKPNGAGFIACCPAHEDRNPSLKVSQGDDGRVLLHCHAGCDLDAVLTALDLRQADLFDQSAPKAEGNGRKILAAYPYLDEAGAELFQVVRFVPKAFRQRRADPNGGWIWSIGDTRRVLYRLPAVRDAIRAGATVYVAEGEKDVAALERAGVVATCSPGGAGKWRPEYAEELRGAASVVIVADDDEPGYKHAEQVRISLVGKVGAISVVRAASGKDAFDHLEAGHTVEQFVDTADAGSSLHVTNLAEIGDLPKPEVLHLDDGSAALFYRGLNDLHAAPGLGKTMIADIAAAQLLNAGRNAAVIDYEGNGTEHRDRLRALGVPDEIILDPHRFAHVTLDGKLRPEIEGKHLARLVDALRPALIVWDAWGPALAADGYEENSNTDVFEWRRTVAEPLFEYDAAQLTIDHVSRSPERTRGGRGAGAKLQVLTGASYELVSIAHFARTTPGAVKLKIVKDRNGWIGPIGATAAVIGITPRDLGAHIDVTIRADDGRTTDTANPETGGDWRPTLLMERASQALERANASGTTPSTNALQEAFTGRKVHKLKAIELLIEDGYATRDGRNIRSLKPYRQPTQEPTE
jgi:hypothetical protein